MNSEKVFKWLTYSAAAAVVVTLGAVLLRPDSAKNAIKERLDSYLNVPAPTPIAAAPKPSEMPMDGVSPTPVPSEQPGTESSMEGRQDGEPAAPPVESTATPTPEVTPTPEPTAEPTAAPTPEATAAPTPEATPTSAPSPEPTATPTPAPNPETPQPTTPAPSSNAKPAGTYTVQPGDTYGCIAEKYYGSYEYWPLLVQTNTGVGFEEYRLFVGAVVQLPAVTVTKPASSLCS